MKRLLTLVFLCAAIQVAAQTTPVIIPINYHGYGAHGSHWYTSVVVNNFTTQTIGGLSFQLLVGCSIPEGCFRNELVPGMVGELYGESASGFLLNLPADEADKVVLSARFGEVSRPFGVQLPIARERDFRNDAIVLPRVQLDVRLRTTLRIYSPEPDPIQVRVDLLSAPNYYDSYYSRVITLAAGNFFRPAFGQFDLGADWAVYGIRVVPLPFGEKQPRIWAFVTAVDNATNEVTVITPQ